MDTLYYLDRILTVVFFLETDLKLFAMGCVMYFGNAWCWLDFVIVAVSLINFGASLLGTQFSCVFHPNEFYQTFYEMTSSQVYLGGFPLPIDKGG